MPKSILMIDDDMIVSHHHHRALSREFQVYRCHIADEAYDTFSTQAFDLIILDIMMPHLGRYDVALTEEGLKTGYYVFKDIRSLYPTVPVIVMTNVTDESTLSLFPSDDVNLSVRKKGDFPPLKLSELVSKTLSEK
jgi:DNA-binding response OmpR family regulator